MISIPIEHGLYLAAALFLLGLMGVLVRRNLIFMLMSLEIMLNATGLAFIVAGARWGEAEGQIFFMLILTLAAAEAAIGLALILLIYRHFGTLDADRISEMRG
ncbi:NADH-ubiquinone oxidoreductase chain 4L [Nitrosococcus halophilus Nc 4]|uniref:NADH-quinone oxidoreductase subunit K n=1 Tax=Nitrosococcus halophilus (strain Nc4) TaxID=472759 RepID=D5C508_NITHN|nr:NADH-quinone oxidoreductase subunit NuoK [Nitrosococcus halophilus]ADE15231.1 NADH-ubiquinone oxidoreductase chain 4L [Nitrosococcus halophilus Nc 4]